MKIVKDMCGWRTLIVGQWGFHLFPEKEHRIWGYTQDWYDGPIHNFGLGRFLLIVWTNY